MNREDVQQRLDTFLALLQREQELKEELIALKMYGKKATEDALREKLEQQNELFAEIDRLRNEEMLPILEEIAAFLAEAQSREKRVL